MNVLIINGAPRSGKDTFIDFLTEINKSVYSYSSIDWVKEKARLLGWDGEKDSKGRKFLSDIKDACTDYADIPFRQIVDHMNIAYGSYFDYFCVNIREPQEIQKLVSYCKGVNIPVFTICIVNKKAEEQAENLNNHADTQYKNYEYGNYIANDSTIEDFKNNIDNFIKIGIVN